MFTRHFLIAFSLILISIIFICSPAFPFEVFKYKYEGIEMHIKGRLAQQYTDNFTFQTEENADAQYFTTLTLNMDMQYEGERQKILLRGGVDYWINTEDFDDERVAENISLAYYRDLSEYHRIRLTDRFSHSRFPVSFEEEFGRTEAKLDDYRNSFSFSYIREVSEDITVKTKYDNDIFWTSKEETSRDSVRNRAGVNINYQYDIATSFNLSYDYSIREFEESDEISIQSVRTGLRRLITKKLNFDGYVGWQFTPIGSDTFTWGISLVSDLDFDERTDVYLSFEKSFRTSNDGDIFRGWEVEGEIDRKMLENITGSLSAFYGEGKFDLSGRKDKFLGASCTISYVFNKYLSAAVGYGYSNLDSNDKDREYTRNSISTGITLTF
jgi:hypothetical protein